MYLVGVPYGVNKISNLTSQNFMPFMTLSMQDATNDGLLAVLLVDELKLADPGGVTEILTHTQ